MSNWNIEMENLYETEMKKKVSEDMFFFLKWKISVHIWNYLARNSWVQFSFLLLFFFVGSAFEVTKVKFLKRTAEKKETKKWKLLIFFSFKTYQKSHKENSINIEEKSEYPKKVKVRLSALQSGNLQNLSTQFFYCC